MTQNECHSSITPPKLINGAFSVPTAVSVASMKLWQRTFLPPIIIVLDMCQLVTPELTHSLSGDASEIQEFYCATLIQFVPSNSHYTLWRMELNKLMHLNPRLHKYSDYSIGGEGTHSVTLSGILTHWAPWCRWRRFDCPVLAMLISIPCSSAPDAQCESITMRVRGKVRCHSFRGAFRLLTPLPTKKMGN